MQKCAESPNSQRLLKNNYHVPDSSWSHGLKPPGSSVLHNLPVFAQIHIHWVSDAIQPSHLLPSPFSFASVFPSISYTSTCIHSFFFLNFGLFFVFKIYLFMYLLLGTLGLCCCAGAFPSCSKWGLLSSWHAQASHCGGFSCCGARVRESRLLWL